MFRLFIDIIRKVLLSLSTLLLFPPTLANVYNCRGHICYFSVLVPRCNPLYTQPTTVSSFTLFPSNPRSSEFYIRSRFSATIFLQDSYFSCVLHVQLISYIYIAMTLTIIGMYTRCSVSFTKRGNYKLSQNCLALNTLCYAFPTSCQSGENVVSTSPLHAANC
jgi:hypothetical protein